VGYYIHGAPDGLKAEGTTKRVGSTKRHILFSQDPRSKENAEFVQVSLIISTAVMPPAVPSKEKMLDGKRS
jgi:hypothetical protein